MLDGLIKVDLDEEFVGIRNSWKAPHGGGGIVETIEEELLIFRFAKVVSNFSF